MTSFFERSVLQGRTDLPMSSPKQIRILFSINFYHSDESLDFYEYSQVDKKQKPPFNNKWRRSFTCNRKRNSPRIAPCGTPYFIVPALEKTFSIQTKIFLCEK